MPRPRKLSLISSSLKHKLWVSLALMAVLPLLLSVYLITTYIPQYGVRSSIVFYILISMFIAIFGFWVIKKVVDRVLNVIDEAKQFASGNFTRPVPHNDDDDEVGDLSVALDQLTQRIRLNMDELKSYTEKTAEINVEIQKRVLVLSSLLQISSLISQNSRLTDILHITTEKCRLLANSDIAFLLTKEEGRETFKVEIAEGFSLDTFLKVSIEPASILFDKFDRLNRPFILDKDTHISKNLIEAFHEKFDVRNCLALPVYLRGKVKGILGIANNREGFLYKKDDIELLDIFAKQAGIAIENEVLLRRAEKLEVKDSLTGLFNESFIHSRLQEEIKRAMVYHRPCAFVLINIDKFREYHQKFGALQAESSLKRISSLMQTLVSDIDKVGRIGDNEFAVILPERNKRQSYDVAELIRAKIEALFAGELDAQRRITASGGVSENPLDGMESEELFNKAKDMLKLAKIQGGNKVVTIAEKTVCQ